MTICVVSDVSGSMMEMAKLNIQRMVIRCIAAFDRRNLSFRFFHWAETMNEITDIESALRMTVKPEGKAVLSVLEPLCRTEKTVLLLTDGAFSLDEIIAFSASIGETNSNERTIGLKAIAIGGDADEYKLEKLTGQGNVFAAEELYAALEAFDEYDLE